MELNAQHYLILFEFKERTADKTTQEAVRIEDTASGTAIPELYTSNPYKIQDIKPTINATKARIDFFSIM